MLDNHIIIGTTPTTSLVFDDEFPSLKKILIEPYNITYSSWLSLPLNLLLDSFRIRSVIKKENRQLELIIKEHKINIVISDNRFGLYNEKVKCIYITHQLNIQAGWLSSMANKVHHYYIKKFDQMLVPDFESEEKCLAGKLSRNDSFSNVEYIGPLSRLKNDTSVAEDLDYLIVLSGPEPQRTLLETALLEMANRSSQKICLVRGIGNPNPINVKENIKVINYASAQQLSQLLLSAKNVVCRSGYSTLMDLYALHKKQIILIPTPGQYEQEYLASYWQETHGAKVVLQKDLKGFTFD